MTKSRFTDQQKIDIAEKYKTNKYSCRDLGKEYGCTRGAIYGIVRRRGLKRLGSPSELSRKYTINERYFDTIDTEEKAYFLGFLCADGCNDVTRGLIRLALQESDKEILEKFNLILKSNRPLGYIDYSITHPTWQNQFCLYVNSKYMSKRLSELGCVPAKSLILQFPTEEQVPKRLLRHWLRGMWDGDGNFCAYNIKKNTSRKFTAQLVSTLQVCEKVKEFIISEININSTIGKANKIDTCKRLRFSGRNHVREFMNYIYKDATIYLQRKYDKYHTEGV